MPFINNDFLLSCSAAKRLYHHWAADGPILDYHCHLSPRDIAENRRFSNLHEIWLEGDHYKWRAM
ncbi:MAG: glucuronate isomerase, partial [Bryobacteraceae bacterium]